MKDFFIIIIIICARLQKLTYYKLANIILYNALWPYTLDCDLSQIQLNYVIDNRNTFPWDYGTLDNWNR